MKSGYIASNTLQILLVYKNIVTICHIQKLEFESYEGYIAGSFKISPVKPQVVKQYINIQDDNAPLFQDQVTLVVKHPIYPDITLFQAATDVLISTTDDKEVTFNKFIYTGEFNFIAKEFSPLLPLHAEKVIWTDIDSKQVIGHATEFCSHWSDYLNSAEDFGAVVTVQDYYYGQYMCLGNFTIEYPQNLGSITFLRSALFTDEGSTAKQIIRRCSLDYGEHYLFKPEGFIAFNHNDEVWASGSRIIIT